LKVLRMEPLRRGIAATSRRIIAVAKPRTKRTGAGQTEQQQHEVPAEAIAAEAPAPPPPPTPRRLTPRYGGGSRWAKTSFTAGDDTRDSTPAVRWDRRGSA